MKGIAVDLGRARPDVNDVHARTRSEFENQLEG
jgi:hypothetical protein